MNTAHLKTGPDLSRRTMLLRLSLATIPILGLTRDGARETMSLPAGSITHGVISVYAESFHSTKFIKIYFSEHGKKLSREHLPKNWETMQKDEKEQWEKSIKEKLAKRHNISSSSILVSSPYAALRDEPKGVTMAEQSQINGGKKVLGDVQQRTRMTYIQHQFSQVTGNPILDTLIKTHIVGLVAGESRFNNDAKSGTGAIGVFQLMPHIINNVIVNPEAYTIEQVARNLTKQCTIATRLFRENWKLINRHTKKVAEAYFEGKESNAIHYFMFPLLINSYNTGYPLIRDNLEDFFRTYPTKKSLQDAKTYTEGYDIYWHFTRFGLTNPRTPKYGEDASMYFFKTLGMSRVLS